MNNYFGQCDCNSSISWNYLTTREKEVAKCLIKGMTAKQVSRQLKISAHTVAGYQRSIKKKLRGKTPYELGYILGRLFNTVELV